MIIPFKPPTFFLVTVNINRKAYERPPSVTYLENIIPPKWLLSKAANTKDCHLPKVVQVWREIIIYKRVLSPATERWKRTRLLTLATRPRRVIHTSTAQ